MRLENNKILFTILFHVFSLIAFAQNSNNKFEIAVQESEYTIEMVNLNGFLDSYNTISQGWNWYEQKFEPLKKITINNNSKKTLFAPRVFINNINYYDEQKMLDGILASSYTLLDTLMAVYTFVKNNIHGRFHPDWEAYNKYKAIFQYGYSACSAYVNNIAYMLQSLGISTNEILPYHHHTMQAIIGEKSFLFDGNEEAFYKDLNNSSVVGLTDVYNDKFLIKRTRHFSDRNIFNSQINYTSYSSPFDYGFWTQPSQLDFVLKPGEKIVFDYAEPTLFHQRNDLHTWGFVYLDEVKDIVSNGTYSLNQNFLNIELNDVLNNRQNIVSNTQTDFPNLHSDSEEGGEFSIEFDLPFPVLDVNIQVHLQQATLSDSVLIYYSTDNANWKCIYKSQETGSFIASVNLYDEVAPGVKNALYKYFLKFKFNPQNYAWDCGIDSLEVTTTFQCSRFFLPRFKLGENIIEYTDANGNDPDRNVEVIIEWQENWENKPPNKIVKPTFPLHQSNVDSLFFAFTWEPAIDDDGNEIEDYEFMLSNDERMLYPHSPNFNRTLSSFGYATMRPYFKVNETGWLNHGETYYWRVRAKDTRGAWGEWSDTWSFTPHGVMRPIDVKAEIVGQSVELSWERNPTGTQPDYYKIYASDEMNGFSPEQAVFFATSDTNHFVIPFEKDKPLKSFYRISACDNSRQESLISEAVAIPYPYMYAGYDSIRYGEEFRMNLFSNEKFFPYYNNFYHEDRYYPVIFIDNKPDWLIYEAPVLYSKDTDIARKMVFMDSIERTVAISLYDLRDAGGITTQSVTLHTTSINRKPELMISSNIFQIDKLFTSYITSTDGDVNFGDWHDYSVLIKPSWLNYEILGDTVFLSGFPPRNIFNDTIVSVFVRDSKNETNTYDFPIRLVPENLDYFIHSETQSDLICQIVFSSVDNMHYARIQATQDAELNFNIYSITGILQFSSQRLNLTEGTYYFPIDMNRFPYGVYIFVGYEDNEIRHPIRFIK